VGSSLANVMDLVWSSGAAWFGSLRGRGWLVYGCGCGM